MAIFSRSGKNYRFGSAIIVALFFNGAVLFGLDFSEFPEFENAGSSLSTKNNEAGESFFDQFLYGMIVFSSGKARLLNPQGKEILGVIPAGKMIGIESIIETSLEESAELNFGCGSTLRLAPGTRVRLRPFGLNLEKGACLARHVSPFLPLKILGTSMLLIDRESLVEIEREGEKTMVKVYAGTLRTPGMRSRVTAGQAIEISGKTATFTKFNPEPDSWISARYVIRSGFPEIPFSDLDSTMVQPLPPPPPENSPPASPIPETTSHAFPDDPVLPRSSDSNSRENQTP